MTSDHNRSVLIVEDDAAMLRAVGKVLKGERYEVACASWVDEAIEHLASRKKPFDLVITDLRLPFVNGKSILNAVKVAFPNVPVIIITAFGSPEMKAQCLAEGASAFLEKPLDTPRLLAAIESVLAEREGDESETQRTGGCSPLQSPGTVAAESGTKGKKL